MDGASKFVRGDAISALVITLINIFGGLAMGLLRAHMSIESALSTFTTLTIGDGTLAAVKINPEALNPGDAPLLEDMILTAANQALAQAREISSAEMGKVTAGLNLPGF